MNRTLSLIVHNKSGVLNRVTALFQQRGYNIYALSVGVTENEVLSKMTIVIADIDERGIVQVMNQLGKQIDVLEVTDITECDHNVVQA